MRSLSTYCGTKGSSSRRTNGTQCSCPKARTRKYYAGRWNYKHVYFTIIDYVKGPENVVVDALSSLVPADENDHSSVHLATKCCDRPEPVITEPVAVTAPASTKSPPQRWHLTHDNHWIWEPIPLKAEPHTEAPLSRRIRE